MGKYLMHAIIIIKGDNLRARLDLSDDGEDEAKHAETAKTTEEKTKQQFCLVESFGSTKQKRLLANVRRSKVDVKDLDLSISNSLPVIYNQCKIFFYLIEMPQITTNCIHIVLC